MKKTNIFETHRIISYNTKFGATERPIYQSENWEKKNTAIINFKIKPTNNTKVLFKELMNNYNSDTHCSVITDERIQELIDENINVSLELDILISMQFGFYNVIEFNNDYSEVELTYPSVIKKFSTPTDTRITFNENFKEFFDEFFIFE